MAQTDKKICLSHSISETVTHMIVVFATHMCKMISLAIFSFFQNSDFSGF